ncbi:hypothetical protein BDC45DRAFT_524796 [Circinella umbellata]|nr:hypothetical protein BDC45DRAFT_524796 [Circinella umbellata]
MHINVEAQLYNNPKMFSFAFLYMMYYATDIDTTYSIRRLYTYHADFSCNSRDICNVILICGSNCLQILRIHTRLSNTLFPTFLRYLHLSKKIQKIELKRTFTPNNILPILHNPPNTSLREFHINDFRGTEEAKNQLHNFIANNFTSIQEIRINRT